MSWRQCVWVAVGRGRELWARGRRVTRKSSQLIGSAREMIAAANQAYVDSFEALLTAEQASKLTLLRRAERAQPLLPAFRLFGLLTPEPGGRGPLR